MGLKERRRREKEERRMQILDAARQLLFTKGINATSINQIAKLAELGVGTIYFYYRNKEELFAALQEEGLEILYKKIQDALDSGKTPGERLKKIASAYFKFSYEYKDYFDIINYFLSAPETILSQKLKSRVDMHGTRILEIVENTINEGIRAGLFKAENARRSSLVFWGMLHGLTQLKKMKNTILAGEGHEELIDYATKNFIKGLK